MTDPTLHPFPPGLAADGPAQRVDWGWRVPGHRTVDGEREPVAITCLDFPSSGEDELPHSPHLLTTHDVVRDANATWVVTDPPPGLSVDALLQRGIDTDRPLIATVILTDMLAALGALHAIDRAHGRLTPEYVYLDADGSTVIEGAGLSDPGARLTPTPWSDPRGGSDDLPAADVYAAAAIAFYVATGAHPDYVTPWQRLPDGGLGPALRTVTQADPARRPSAERLSVDLAKAAEDLWGDHWLWEGREHLAVLVAADALASSVRGSWDGGPTALGEAPSGALRDGGLADLGRARPSGSRDGKLAALGGARPSSSGDGGLAALGGARPSGSGDGKPVVLGGVTSSGSGNGAPSALGGVTPSGPRDGEPAARGRFALPSTRARRRGILLAAVAIAVIGATAFSAAVLTGDGGPSTSTTDRVTGLTSPSSPEPTAAGRVPAPSPGETLNPGLPDVERLAEGTATPAPTGTFIPGESAQPEASATATVPDEGQTTAPTKPTRSPKPTRSATPSEEPPVPSATPTADPEPTETTPSEPSPTEPEPTPEPTEDPAR